MRARDATVLKAAADAVATMIETIGQEKTLSASKGDATA